jgi:hypothetical protein
MYIKILKKTMYKVPQHQQSYHYVGLFLIETLKHSNTILKYSILEYQKNVHKITEKYNKIQADNNIAT